MRVCDFTVLCVPLWFASVQAAHGQVIVNADGTHSVMMGNVIVNQNGSHSVIHGNILIAPDGSHTFFAGKKQKQLAKQIMLRDSATMPLKNRENWLFLLFGINNNRKAGAKKEN